MRPNLRVILGVLAGVVTRLLFGRDDPFGIDEEECRDPSRAPEVYGPTDINAQVANQRLAVAMNGEGTITVFRYPTPSYYDHIKYRTSYRDRPLLGAEPNEGSFLGIVLDSGEQTVFEDKEAAGAGLVSRAVEHRHGPVSVGIRRDRPPETTGRFFDRHPRTDSERDDKTVRTDGRLRGRRGRRPEREHPVPRADDRGIADTAVLSGRSRHGARVHHRRQFDRERPAVGHPGARGGENNVELRQTIVGAGPIWLGLDSAVKAAAELGNRRDATVWRYRRERLGRGIERLLFDREGGFYGKRSRPGFPEQLWPIAFHGINSHPLDVAAQRLKSLHDAVFAVEWEQGRPVGLDTAASVVV